MIKDTFEEALSPEWVAANITNPAHALVLLRRIIPWGPSSPFRLRFMPGADPWGSSGLMKRSLIQPPETDPVFVTGSRVVGSVSS